LTTFRGVFFAGGADAAGAGGGVAAAASSLILRAKITPPQPRFGHVPRHVMRPLAAVVSTTRAHFGQVPRTFSGSAICYPRGRYGTPHAGLRICPGRGVSYPVVTVDLASLATRLERTAIAAHDAAQLARADREARDRVIEEADLAGMGIREISRHTGLAPGHVQRIIGARTAARQA